ncbi:HAD family hydrolase [Cerasibacillus sp. JNUCC 74]
MRKAIIFDLDDTLLWDKKSVAESFKEACNKANKINPKIDPIDLEESVREKARSLYASYSTYPFTQMIGINPFEGLWGEFDDEGKAFQQLKEIAPIYRKEAWEKGLEGVGVEDRQLAIELAETFPKVRKKKPFVFEDTFDVLDALANDFKLALLTNGSPDLQQTKLEMTPKLKGYFEEIVVSGDFGSGKPDPAIFQYTLEKLDVKEEEAIMVGDNLHTDILGASRSGIDSVWINRQDLQTNGLPTFEVESLTELLSLINQHV